MKVGIITYHNGSNYGAALQTFALQEAEKKLGNNPFVVNYNNRFISQGLDRIRFAFSLLGIYNLVCDIINFKSNGRKIIRFLKFFRDYYNLTDLMSADELRNSNAGFELGISGSDQIWNPLLNKDIDDIYFLNFGKFSKKISYASSLGNYKLNDSKINKKIKGFLSNYYKISTREKADQLEKVIQRKVELVCDPTLLLTKEDWKEKLAISRRDEGYVLVYALADMNNVITFAKKIAIERNLRIINIGFVPGHHFDIDNVLDAGPKEFVELFYNADYIVTNSFHGTAFSINFHKQFLSIRHPKSPERAMSFLQSVGLESRLITSLSEKIPMDITALEYNAVECRLDEIRNNSYNFLNINL